MKRILIFSLAYYPQVGGAEVAIKEITDRIASSDVEFHMVTLRFSPADAKEEKMGNIFVHRVGDSSSYLSKILFIPRAARRALQLDIRQFDALWAMMSYMLFPITLLRFMHIRTPYVLTLQEGDPSEHVFSRWYIKPFSPLLRYGFRHATSVQTISNFLATWARREGYAGAIEVIPNGVDIQKFTGAPVAHEDTVLITTSRLVRKNGIDEVIKALKDLPRTVSFKILGIGPDEAMLKKLAHNVGVADRVQFVGHVDHAQLPAHLHAADIFIRPSRSEGMGNSFIEAMAAGLPVIATREGGLADFITPNETAWAVVKDSPKQIAEAVLDILAHPEQAAKVVENAKKMVQEKYDWDLIAKAMREKVFAKVL